MSITDLGQIDLYTLESFANGHPYEQLAYLREHDPVHRHAEPNGPGFWAVTRWTDIRFVNVHEDLFSHWPVSMIEDYMETPHKSFVNLDPPIHTEIRQAAMPTFLPKAVRKRVPAYEAAARQIVEDIAPPGRCDLVIDIAGKMAACIAADVLAIPVDDAEALYEYIEIGLAGGGAYTVDERRAATQALVDYSIGIWEDRRRDPGEDVCSQLAHCNVGGQPMTLEDFCAHLTLLIVGAGDTTRHLIGGGVQALFEFPDQRALLASAPEVHMAKAVEEMLRWVTPTGYNRRNAKVDVELGGKTIKAGDKLCVYYSSGNRDPEQFADPNRFDVMRWPNHQLSFSGFGQHFCMGAQVARVSTGAMVGALLTALPDLRPDGDIVWERSNFVQGPAHLPVAW